MSSASGTYDLDSGETEPMTSPRLPLPDPPLVDEAAGIRLRPWVPTRQDAESLAAAWSDPAIAAANRVPDDASVEVAERWFAGDAARREAGRSLDLVVTPLADRATAGGGGGGAVLGEVGLRNLDPVRRWAEISWWVLPRHRGHGLATAATRLVVAWALSPEGLHLAQVWARIGPSNAASAHVATAAGLADLGPAAGAHIWARSC
jgi:RimJ/RimL family protein N-acetyltransferase